MRWSRDEKKTSMYRISLKGVYSYRAHLKDCGGRQKILAQNLLVFVVVHVANILKGRL